MTMRSQISSRVKTLKARWNSSARPEEGQDRENKMSAVLLGRAHTARACCSHFSLACSYLYITGCDIASQCKVVPSHNPNGKDILAGKALFQRSSPI
jgi:hypothetical protein